MKDKKINDINFSFISKEEKSKLKSRIKKSIHAFIWKKRLKYGLGIASSVILLISIGLYITSTQTSSINNYVKTAEELNSDNIQSVKLILNDKQDIEIDDDTNISYSNSGEEVKIGNNQAISQTVIQSSKIVYNMLLVPYGKRSQIDLSDGSKVWLNSGSKLIYPIAFKEKRREVYLEGEAIFEVSHNKEHPFIVMSDNHEIEVLGTVFNVSNYPDEDTIKTTLKSGSVQINIKESSLFKSNKKLKITPGTMSLYNKDSNAISSKKADVSKAFSWRDGILIFKNDNLDIIMKRISRYYNVKVIINNDDLAKETFSGFLDLKENIDDVLKTINETTSFELISKNDKEIIIN